MDEKKLAELFNEAVRDVPPASFGTGDVRQASYRATARRRSTIVAASVLGIVLLGGGAITTIALTGGNANTTASGPASAGSAGPGGSGTMGSNGGDAAPPPQVEQQQIPAAPNDRSEGPKQGGSPSGTAGGSAGDTPGGCEKADRELAAALASELPAAAIVTPTPQPVPFGCPPGSRAASYKVVDHARSGTLSVVLVPKGVSPGIAPMGIAVPGTVNFNAPAVQSGGTVYIVSQPTPELTEPPFNEVGIALAAGVGQHF